MQRPEVNKWIGLQAVMLALVMIWVLNLTAQERQGPDWQAQVREQVAKKDLAGALRITEGRLDAAPKDLEARGWRARLLNWSGRRAESEQEYRTVLESFPDDTDMLQGLADVLMAEQRYDEAMALLARARDLLPRSAEVQVRRGRALRAMGRSEEARNAFQAERRDGIASACVGHPSQKGKCR